MEIPGFERCCGPFMVKLRVAFMRRRPDGDVVGTCMNSLGYSSIL